MEYGAAPDGPPGRMPRTVTADRGYGQPTVERDLQALGVRTPAIPRQAKTSPARKATEHSRFRKLVKWRTGSEGRISYLTHTYGWNRTRLDGKDGAAIWCGQGVFTHNLPAPDKMTPDDLVLVWMHGSDDDLEAELASWTDSRGEEQGARELLAFAADGNAATRTAAITMLSRLGQAAEPAWREALDRVRAPLLCQAAARQAGRSRSGRHRSARRTRTRASGHRMADRRYVGPVQSL